MAILTPSDYASAINAVLSTAVVAPLAQRSTFLSLPGLTVIDTAAPLRVPVAAVTSPTAAFTAPGAAITQQAVALSEVDLLPSNRVGIKSLSVLSNEAIRQATVALESVVTQRLTYDMAIVLDAALYNGAGTSNSITGILAASGITTSANADLLTDPDVLIDALAAMAELFVSPSVLVMRPTTFAALRKIKVSDTDARYVFDPSAAFAVAQQSLFGLPVVTTTAVPANAIAVLDTSQIVVARDIDSAVAVLDQTYGGNDALGIRVVSRYDVALTHPHAVSLLTVS